METINYIYFDMAPETYNSSPPLAAMNVYLTRAHVGSDLSARAIQLSQALMMATCRPFFNPSFDAQTSLLHPSRVSTSLPRIGRVPSSSNTMRSSTKPLH